MLSINSMIANPGPASFYTEAWRVLVEDHIDYFRKHPDTARLDISGIKRYQHNFDLFSILVEHAIPNQYHWAIMRINGFSSTNDYLEDMEYILIPSDTELNRLNKFVASS